MADLRSAVARQMVRFHEIPPELAEYHVSHMDPAEVKETFLSYWRRRHTTQSDGALAERSEGDAAQKTCAYGPREAKLAGQKWSDPTASWSAATEHEARPTFTSELGANHGRPGEIPDSPGNMSRVLALALGVGCALGLREPSRPGTSMAEYGQTTNLPPKCDSGAFPPQGGGEGWFCL